MFRYLRFYWSRRAWRYATMARVWLSPSFQERWAEVFATHPSLYLARRTFCFKTMSGFYNDMVPGGFMSTDEARRIYWQWGCK